MQEIENFVNPSPSKYRNVMSPIKRRGHVGRDQLKCDGTRAETRVLLSAKRKSPFKSAGVSAQSTTGSRGVRISFYRW